jgi:hypothetical protein
VAVVAAAAACGGRIGTTSEGVGASGSSPQVTEPSTKPTATATGTGSPSPPAPPGAPSPVARLQPSDVHAQNNLGVRVALSADGSTLATVALDTAKTYVYARHGSGWVQQADLTPSGGTAVVAIGGAIALAADGNTVALGTSDGAFVFVRSGATWSQQTFLRDPAVGIGLSASVALSGDGSLVGVGSPEEATQGVVHLHARQSDLTWSEVAVLTAPMPSAEAGAASLHFGSSVAMTPDGSRLAVGAPGAGTVGVFTAPTTAGGAWGLEAEIHATDPNANAALGATVSLSANGDTLAAADADEVSLAMGVNTTGPLDTRGGQGEGAAFVFVRSGAAWSQQAYIKASNTTTGALNAQFGVGVALSPDGALLAVGAPFESSGATGVNGNAKDTSASGAGAVYIFWRDGSSWAPQAYVKASDTQAYVHFGESVALSSGYTLAVGAPGVDAAEGAVYTYSL